MFRFNKYHHAARPAVAAIVGAIFASASASAETAQSFPQSISRTDLQRHDLSIAGHETIQSRVDFAPGAVAPKHKHPGEEIVYVLKGTLVYELDGQPPVTLNVGDVLFIPARTAHSVRNLADGTSSELATYVVNKDEPLLIPAK
ncbi:cupin domain-containing protein [Rhizobium jaguaris]|uniref:cupin domain-containing protein n=1 Tax=Rhizobium jaguaris TaxID=1312183 RepID=UPI0039BF98F4